MKVGSVVVSLWGHDIGDWFLVAKTDGKFAYVVDGKNRKINKPKKKNVKHLHKTDFVCEEFKNILNSKQNTTDAYVRKTLKIFKEH